MFVRQHEICWLDNGTITSGEKLPYLEAKTIRGIQEAKQVSSGIVVEGGQRIILVDGENSGEIMNVPYRGYMGSTFRILKTSSLYNYQMISYYFLLNKDKYKNNKRGTAIPHLSKDIFRSLLIPLPPLAEQQRIVEKIELLFNEIDKIDKAQDELDHLRKLTKTKILDLAMRGKLIEQDPNDEPASILLDKIKQEKEKLVKEGKIKRDKNESTIYQGDDKNYYEKIGNRVTDITDEIPFEIPNSWSLVRLKSISNIAYGGTPSRTEKKYWDNGTIPWLKIADLTNSEKYVEQASEYITEIGLNESSAKLISKGSILYTIFATIGETKILNIDAACNQAIASINPYLSSLRDFLYYFLMNLQNYVKAISRGIAQSNINLTILSNIVIPIPPLAEQQRIVEKIELLFNQI